MEIYKIENLSFTYPDSEYKAVNDVTLLVNQGEFITLCGASGSGKTTLLRLLKSSLSPHGNKTGNVYFNDKHLDEIDLRNETSKIGFVMQSPENQIVCDKVWHEIAFGLENLGLKTGEIRVRVSEIASFFGIESWFYKNTNELSGGQKQLLNLASVMVMQPDVLILDEPTSQLDPISAQEFLKTLKKINTEFGTTVILSEHRLEDAISISDRVIVMDEGKIIADNVPKNIGKTLKEMHHIMYYALPAPIRIWSETDGRSECPITVRDGRKWLNKYAENNVIDAGLIPKNNTEHIGKTIIEVKDAYFKYEKDLPYVIKGLNVSIKEGEFFAIVGGNGAGKSTFLSLISGINKAQSGKVFIDGTELSKIDGLYNGMLGVLPQNPQSLFTKKTVYEEVNSMLQGDMPICEKEKLISDVSFLCHIDNLFKKHPFDLSGGQMQRVALAKVLLLSPKILILDEPTKGMDAYFKFEFANILKNLLLNNVTIVMVSHDIEFCAQYAHRCAFFFDGNITSLDNAKEFFAGKNFYTTSVNRMARTLLPNAVTTDDILCAMDKKCEEIQKNTQQKEIYTICHKTDEKPKENKKVSPFRIFLGAVLLVVFLLIVAYQFIGENISSYEGMYLHLSSLLTLSLSIICFKNNKKTHKTNVQSHTVNEKLNKITLASALFMLFAVPATILFGIYCLDDAKYYFISFAIILETLIPFLMMFEKRKPKAKELVIISVLCALVVASRMAFFMLHQFKPIVALVIISGVCFGAETGFLVGSVSAFISNFFFGQGPWTPWQMFSLGLIGFIAGILFGRGFLKRTKTSLSVFGFIATLLIYGVIMNTSSIFMMKMPLSIETIVSFCIAGFPLDIIHAVSTVFFLWFISDVMIEKLERVKTKYGLM